MGENTQSFPVPCVLVAHFKERFGMEWFKVKHNEFHNIPDLKLIGAIHVIRCLNWQNESPIAIKNLPRIIKRKYIEILTKHDDFCIENEFIFSISVQNQINSLHKKRAKDNKDFAHIREKTSKIESETISNRTSRTEQNRTEQINDAIYLTKNPVLSMSRTIPSILTFIRKQDIPQDIKKDIEIKVMACAKQPHTIYEIHELVESALPKNNNTQGKTSVIDEIIKEQGVIK